MTDPFHAVERLQNASRTMTRRETLLAGTVMLTAGSTWSADVTGAPSAARRPNVLFIVADDLAAGDLSCYGRPDYRTPRIDSLCAGGVRLTHAYANSCTCSPSRVALLSGRYQNRLDVGNYDPLPPGRGIGFPSDHPTLASTLKRAGYVTGLVGKWHLGDAATSSPTACGYDEFFGLRGSHVDYFTHAARTIPAGETVGDLYENDTPVRREGYATRLFTARAARFISENRRHPFLLSVHYTAPHWPWQAPGDLGTARLNDMHYDGGSRAVFAAMVTELDSGVGSLLTTLRDAGIERDTIVIFTSDNGGERYSYHWPLRGAKFDLWEGGIRVPCIVRWPGRIAACTTCDQVVLSMDWLATLAGAAGARMDDGYSPDGIDVMPALAGERPPVERTVFWRTQWAHAVRSGRWKYVATRGHDYLFDLSVDEMERANLQRREQAVLAELKRAYADWNDIMKPIPADARVPPDLYERFEALEIG